MPRLRASRPTAPADAETVHHFRTTIRRLRSLLSSFKEVSPAGSARFCRPPQGPVAALCRRCDNGTRSSRPLEQSRSATNAAHPPVAGGSRRESAGGAIDCAAASRWRRTSRRSTAPSVEAEWLHEPSPGETKLWNERIDEYAAGAAGQAMAQAAQGFAAARSLRSAVLPQVPHRGEEAPLHHRIPRLALSQEGREALSAARRRASGRARRYA